MKRSLVLLFVVATLAGAAERRAKNVILFIGDAGGLPTLSAASIHGHKAPQKLFIQHMPNIGLMDTTPANSWVTDSAAGMSAIVTGYKTNNGVLSQLPPEGGKEGAAVKTILEYAEEHGLSTGVLSNMSMVDATPAACYSHVSARGKAGEIFAQVFKPRFGDGVDLIIGAGRTTIYAETQKMGIDVEPALKKKGYAVYDSLDAISDSDRRVVALFDTGEFGFDRAVPRAISILSRNPKGFFLMAECDTHTTNPKQGLDRMLLLDATIRKTVESAPKDTLVIFAADHSFDFRVRGGKRGADLLVGDGTDVQAQGAKPAFRMDNSHTGEEVVVAAQGPGAGRVHGFIANTDLFQIMLSAWGWKK